MLTPPVAVSVRNLPPHGLVALAEQLRQVGVHVRIVNLNHDVLKASHAAESIAGVKPDDYAKPTPCTEWDVRTLANHMAGGASMFAGIINGR